MMRNERTGWYDLFLRDASRWVIPEEHSDPADLTPRIILQMLMRYPALRAMAWLRLGGWMRVHGVRGGPSWVQRRLLRLYGLEIQPGMRIGGGCYIAHPVGVVLQVTEIGDDVTIIGSVTVGLNKELVWPTIGDRVFLGVGCRVLGSITIGDDVRVGANAVVLTDAPDGVTMVGVPARPLAVDRQ